MKITYRIKTGEVVMLNSDIKNDSLETVEVPDDSRFGQGYLMFYRDGQIEFKKSPSMENEDKQKKMKQDFENDIADIDNAVNDPKELKKLLTNLITKVYNQ